jgi:signal transduction histidine kinase/DNA-binding response OmpR family regulator
MRAESGWRGLWSHAVDMWIAPSVRSDPDGYRRARLAVAGALVCVPFGGAFSVIYPLVLPPPLGVYLGALVFGLLPVALLLLATMRLLERTAFGTNGILAYALTCFCLISYELGGARAAALYWLIGLPSVAVLVGNARRGVAWFAAGQLGCLGFLVLDARGHPFPHEATRAQLLTLWLTSASGLTLLLCAMVGVFESAKYEALALLRRANTALVRARDAARNANRTKSAFLARISHEIRTPMTAILGFADLLIDRLRSAPRTPADIEALETIRRNGRHLLEIINDILDLSKIEAGRLEIERRSFDPAHVVADVMALMSIRAEEGGLELRTEHAGEIPGRVFGDPTRVKQILMNLVGNAIKFTSRGSVTVRLSFDAPARQLRLEVADTGIGLSPEQLAGLFVPFSQADTSTSRLYGGTGLGLSICRRLCELMGGRIDAESELGRGSRFRVELPAEDAGPPRPADAPRPPDAPLAAGRGIGTLSRRHRILFADDVEDNRELVSGLLGRAGAEVVLADGGKAAVLEVRRAQKPFDLVLLDLEMPGLDGSAVTRILRGQGYQGPIVALSAHAMAGERERCFALGFDALVAKPIEAPELIAVIERHSGQRSVKRPAGEGQSSAAVSEPIEVAERSAWERFADRFVPLAFHRDPEALERARAVVGIAIVPVPLILGWACLLPQVMLPPVGPVLSVLVALTGLMLLGIPFLLRRYGSVQLAANLLATYGYVVTGLVACASGGAMSPSSHWLLVIAVAMMPVLGGRAAALWTGLCVVQYGAFYAVELSGFQLRNWMIEQDESLASILSVSSLMAITTGLTLLYQRGKESALGTLASANGELESARDEADRANRTKSEFLANISHEIRTPMTAILGYSELLDEEWKASGAPEELQRGIATVHRNGVHLLGIINDLLDLSRIEAGKLELERIGFSPLEVCNDAVDLLRVRAEARDLELRLRIDPPLPARVRGDPTRLRQVLINLVGNALKFTDAGHVELRVSSRGTPDSPCLRFEVSDTGVGMTPAELERLFQPFQQGAAPRGRKESGTGLGLAISQLLCELMGGRIAVESRPGEGSRFHFEIPAPIVASETDAGAVEVEPAEAGPRIACRVLLAEDGADNRRLITRILTLSGVDVRIAENGQCALEIVEAAQAAGTPFDLVLMDMQMPVLDGYGAVQELRRRGYTIPIIALTAHALAEERARCLEAGCDDFATKPIDRSRLLALVQNWASELKS